MDCSVEEDLQTRTVLSSLPLIISNAEEELEIVLELLFTLLDRRVEIE